MEHNQKAPIDTPASYRICITGRLERELAERLWGITARPIENTADPDQTALVGEVTDQAALVGIINALYNFGHIIVSVERLFPDTGHHLEETMKEGSANNTQN